MARKKIGRPTKLTRAFLAGYVAILEGAVYRVVAAQVMGVDYSTIRRWLRRGEAELADGRDTIAGQFCLAVTRAEAVAEVHCVGAIRTAALGWDKVTEVIEEFPIVVKGENGEPDRIETRMRRTRQVVRERDVRASMWWLERKCPEHWGRRARSEVQAEPSGA